MFTSHDISRYFRRFFDITVISGEVTDIWHLTQFNFLTVEIKKKQSFQPSFISLWSRLLKKLFPNYSTTVGISTFLFLKFDNWWYEEVNLPVNNTKLFQIVPIIQRLFNLKILVMKILPWRGKSTKYVLRIGIMWEHHREISSMIHWF